MKKYQATLNLPKTDFPMKANLKEKEVLLLAKWETEQLYPEILKKGEGKPKYILHDGPPYANGHIHIGHALNKILKDIVVKSKTMSGYAAPYVPGWDCHGLPIEHQVLKDLGPKRAGMDKVAIRKLCRDYAQKFIAIQKAEFKRLGVLGDWENPYLTLTPDYEAAIVREFGKIVAAGSVYKGLKPVLWCSSCETALAEAEVEYADHTSPSIYVKFPLYAQHEESLLNIFAAMGIADSDQTRQITGKNLSIVIWTTTPWTLVANRAVCLHPDFNYVVCLIQNEAVIVSEPLYESFIKETGLDHGTIVCTFKGSQIEGWQFNHPWLDRRSVVILGNHVTAEGGTGCVHTAPGHGREDYEVGLKYGIAPYAPVDKKGRFTAEAEQFAALPVFEANAQIIALLQGKGMLVKEKKIVHSYPHCWRCKNPVLFRATDQWFVSMETTKLRERALDEIEKVQWIPKWGKDRIIGAVGNRPDWCISRQRVWGVPIVAFTCIACKKQVCTQAIIDPIANQMETEGSDLWFSKSAKELLPIGMTCSCGSGDFEKENDILDVWFESGVSHAAVLKARGTLSWPADLYLEGSDQHRGWFQSTLLASLETDKKAAFETVLTHGFTVDGEGKKMSKSVGNVVAPQEITDKYGAEILRLWVAATDFRDDVRISDVILQQLVEAYRKIRNTCRFLLSNLYDYQKETASGNKQLEIDVWALNRLSQLNERVQQSYATMEFHAVFHAINQFCSVELSAFYLDIIKDRLYASKADAPERRAAQFVLHEILITLTKLMAPILSFTTEEIWQSLPVGFREEAASVHLTSFPEKMPNDLNLEDKWVRLRAARELVSKKLEEARANKTIGTSLEASISITATSKAFQDLKSREAFLPSFFIVSQVKLEESSVWNVTVEAADGEKCERCWLFSEAVGSDVTHPTLCKRCCEAVPPTGGGEL
ncbi:MAG: isoleucine--tRNA ligase [Nitrospirota bacterium]